MDVVLLGILAAAAALVAIFLLPALLELKRAARSATLTLDAIRSEIRPTLQVVQGTLQEFRALANRANQDLLRIEETVEHAKRMLDPAVKLVELTRAAGKVTQITLLARAAQKGVGVFLDRLGKLPGGDYHDLRKQ